MSDIISELKAKCDYCSPCPGCRKIKRMYSHNKLDLDIVDVVDQMHEDTLDWAMDQVQRTLAKGKR